MPLSDEDLTAGLADMQANSASARLTGAQGTPPSQAASAVRYAPQAQLPPSAGLADPTVIENIARTNEQQRVLASSAPVRHFVNSADPAHVAVVQDDLGALARVGESAQKYWSKGGPFGDIADAFGANWRAAQVAAQRQLDAAKRGDVHDYFEQGTARLFSEAALPFSIFSAIGEPLARAKYAFDQSPAGKFVAGHVQPFDTSGLKPGDPDFPDDSPEGQARSAEGFGNYLAGLVPLGGVGKAAETRVGGGEPLPQSPHLGSDNRWTTTPEGFVADSEGNPVHFTSQKEAGVWAMREGYSAPTDQIFEPANSVEGGTFHVKEVGRTEAPVANVPAVGAHPGVDAVRATVAESDAQAIAEIQQSVAESATHGASPGTMQAFLDQQVPNQTAWVDPGVVAKLWSDGHAVFLGEAKNVANAFSNGQEVPIPLAQYLTETAGKPFEEELRKATRFREDGVSQDEVEHLQKLPATPKGPPDVAPDEAMLAKLVEGDPDLLQTPEAQEQLKLAGPAVKQAAVMATKSTYLGQVFEDPSALGMTQAQFARYSEKLKEVQQLIYNKTLEAVKDRVKRSQLEIWRAAYTRHHQAVTNEVMTSPPVVAYHTLAHGVVGTKNLAADNDFAANGAPVTFHHGTTHLNIETWRVPEFSPHKVISFAEDPHFASEWVMAKPEGGDRRRFVYVVHLKAKSVADFRKPEHVEKALAWYKQHAPFGSDEYMRAQLAAGSWSKWENPKMWKALGWDATRMVEYPGQKVPNAAVANGDQVHFKYAPDLYPESLKLRPLEKGEYPEAITSRLPKNIFAANGVSADQAAETFGIESGERLLRELAAIEEQRGSLSFKQWIKKTTEATAAERAGLEVDKALDPATIEKLAKDSVAQPVVRDLLSAELRAIADKLGSGVKVNLGDIEAKAEEMFAALPLRQARNVKIFERAMWSMGNKAQRALEEGKWADAFLHKQRQLVNHMQLAMAHDILRQSNQANRLFKSWAGVAVIPRMDPETANWLHVNLARLGYGLQRNEQELLRTIAASDRPSQGEYLAHVNAMGYPVPEVSVPGKFQDLTVGEFQAIRDMLLPVAEYGREASQLRDAAETWTLNDLAFQVAANAGGIGRKFPPARLAEARRNAFRRIGSSLKTLFVANLRPEVYLHWMDGEQQGPLMKWAVNGLMKGKFTETDLTDKWVSGVNKFFSENKTWAKQWDQKVDHGGLMDWESPEGKVPVIQTRGQLRMALLNMGNAGNFDKLFKGYGWGEEQERWLMDNATKEDWDFAQHIWDANDGLFAKAEEVYRRVRGVGLKKTIPREVATQWGVYRGGYFHLHYDNALRNLARIGRGSLTPDLSGGDLFASIPTASMPNAWYVRERTNYSAPLNLDPANLSVGITQAIHDIAYREALIQANKILIDPRVQQAIEGVLGPEYRAQILPWLKYVAQERVFYDPATDKLASLVRQLRSNIVFAKVAYNVKSALLHAGVGFSHMNGEIGNPVALGQAVSDLLGNGPKAEYWRRFVLENSGEVRGMAWSLDPSLREAMSQGALKFGNLARFKRGGFTLFALAKQIEAFPTWLASYRLNMAKYGEHELAVAAADKSVRDTQGAGAPVDTPALLRHGGDALSELGALAINTLMGFRNTTANRFFTVGKLLGRRDEGDLGRAGGLTLGYVLGAALWTTLFSLFVANQYNPRKSTEENMADELTWSMSEQTLGSFVGLSMLEQAARYQSGGMLQTTERSTQNTLHNAFNLAQGKKVNHRWVEDAVAMVGELTGVLPESFGRALGYASHADDYDQRGLPHNPVKHVQGVLFGPPPKPQRKHK